MGLFDQIVLSEKMKKDALKDLNEHGITTSVYLRRKFKISPDAAKELMKWLKGCENTICTYEKGNLISIKVLDCIQD